MHVGYRSPVYSLLLLLLVHWWEADAHFPVQSMEEKTPLLSETVNHNEGNSSADILHARWGEENLAFAFASPFVSNRTVTMRPTSAPPIRGNVHSDDSDDDLFSRGKCRPKTSVGYSAADDEEWIGRTLNRQRSGENEDEVCLNKDANKHSEKGKSKVMNLVIVYIILVIWSIATHIHGPVYTQYLYRRIQEEVFGNSSISSSGNNTQLNATECFKPSPNKSSDDDGAYTLQEKAQQLTTEINMKLSLCSLAFCFVSTVLFGTYSDYFGRKMIFLIPLIGHLADYVMVTLIIYFEMDINYFFLTGSISGICTSEIFSIACYAYVADNTPPKGSRTIGIAVISVIQALTSAALATGVGYYIQLEGYFLPSVTAAAILVLDIVAVICILPERKRIPSDPSVRERKKDEKANLNPLKAVRNVFGIYFFDGSFKTRAMFLLYLAAYFTHEIAMRMGNIGTLWEMNYPLCWDPVMMGYYGTGATIFAELIKLPLLKFLQCFLNEELIAIWSNIVYSGSLVLKSFSQSNLMMYGVAFISAFDISVTVIIQSTMSQMAGPDRQGALFSSFAIVGIICSFLGTPAFSELYKYTVNLFRGTSYLVSAGVQCICTLFLIVFAVLAKKGYKSGTEVIHLRDNQSTQTSRPSQPDEDTNV